MTSTFDIVVGKSSHWRRGRGAGLSIILAFIGTYCSPRSQTNKSISVKKILKNTVIANVEIGLSVIIPPYGSMGNT